MKKLVSLLLLMALIATVSVSCKKGSDDEDTTAAGTTADAQTTTADTTDAVTDADDTMTPDTEAQDKKKDYLEISKATPIIDGVIDDAYRTSGSYTISDTPFWNAGKSDKKVSAKTYFLWDENYLYALVDVKDPAVVSRGADYYKEVPADGQLEKKIASTLYKDDSAELWFLYNNQLISLVHADAAGHTLYTTPTDDGGLGKTPGVIFDIAHSQKKAVISNDGYIIEMALKLDGNVTAENEAGMEIQYCLQINDISALSEDDDNDELQLCCWGEQKPLSKFVFAE